MAMVEVKVPDIGDFEEVEVIELLVKAGRHGQGRAVADHGRVGQGLDGDSVERRPASSRSSRSSSATRSSEGSRGAGARGRRRRRGARAAAAAPAPAPAAAPAPAPAPAAAAPAAGSGPVEVRVPDIGDFKDVAVIEVLVKPGDTVKVEQTPDHGRERQGVDGDPVVARRRGQGAEGQGRRQGQHGRR